MAYPEKITYPAKQNARAVTDPNTQLSAQEVNEIKDKLNKNALFHDVHDNLSALQAAFPNPPKGAFAYLIDGSCYRCVNIGWVTKEGAGGSEYFKGYYAAGGGQTALEKLKAAHPASIPGARAILKVEGANDLEALWDEDAQDWFAFELSNVTQSYIDQKDAETLQAAKDFAQGLLGTPAGETKILSATVVHRPDLSPLTFDVYGIWIFAGEQFGTENAPVFLRIVLDAADANFGRFDLIAFDNTGAIVKVTGASSATPEKPSLDLATQLEVKFFFLPANASQPDGISATVIYDEGDPGDWALTENTGGARIDPASGTDPANGLKGIEATGLKKYDRINLSAPGGEIDAGDLDGIKFRIKNKIESGSDNPIYFSVQGKTTDGQSVSYALGNLPAYGWDKTNLQDHQSIRLPVDKPTLAKITGFQILFVGSNGDGYGFFLDAIEYTAGLNIDINDFVKREELEAAKSELKSYSDRIKSPITKSANFMITDLADQDGKRMHDNKIFCINASQITATIPNDATENIPIGFETNIFWIGAGSVIFNQEANVTLNFDSTELAEIIAQFNGITLIKTGANTWLIIGALKAA